MKSKGIAILFLIAGILATAQTTVETHRVQQGQTLYSLSRLYGVSVEEIMEWNNLDTNTLRIGQQLLVSTPENPEGPRTSGFSLDTHKVIYGDSLGSIALKYRTTVEELRRINGLRNDYLRIGQEIYIRPPVNLTIYTVAPGDTLSGVSYRFDISQDELLFINNLDSPSLSVGQKLRVVNPQSAPLFHKVESMDSLESLAFMYNMDAEEIMRLNSLTSSILVPGQEISLRSFSTASIGTDQVSTQNNASSEPVETNVEEQTLTSVTYLIRPGDTLYGLSLRFEVTVDQLRDWNGIENDLIRPGQNLTVFVSEGAMENAVAESLNTSVANSGLDLNNSDSTEDQTQNDTAQNNSLAQHENVEDTSELSTDPTQLTWESYVILDRDIPLYEWNNDFYYWSHPGLNTQPNRGYFEGEELSPMTAFERANKLMEEFDMLIDRKQSLSNTLEGVTIILDPGHGGLDPGAIVKSTDGLGDDLYVTEDEYAHDIALRMYVLLKRHGANVELTVISPNHLIRDTTPATRTLIHEKNEVFNSLALNEPDTAESWPIGGRRGLERRVQVAEELMALHPGTETIFLSIHADNSPFAPSGSGALYYQDENRTDTDGSEFAEALSGFLGSQAYTRGQNLGVLRDNPADLKLLMEVRNVAYKDQAWALRFANTRQMDALKIVNGILAYFE